MRSNINILLRDIRAISLKSAGVAFIKMYANTADMCVEG